MKRSLGTLAVLACLALAGCSSTTEPPAANEPPSTTVEAPSPVASPSPESPSPEAAEDTLESIADRVGVEDLEPGADAVPGAVAWGKGTLDDVVVRVYEFTGDEGYETFLSFIGAYGVTEESLVRAGNFAVAPDDAELLEQINEALQ